jgi:HEAT repeat protein
LIELLKDTDEALRRQTAVALAEIADPAAAPALLYLAAAEKSHTVRAAVASALRTFGGENVRMALQRLLHDNEPSVVLAAAVSLAHHGSQEGLPKVLDMFRESPSRAVAEALVEMHWRPPDAGQAARLLIARQCFADAAGLGSEAVPPLLENLRMRLKEPCDWWKVEEPAKALCTIVPETLRKLERYLDSEYYPERWRAAAEIVSILDGGPPHYIEQTLDDDALLEGMEIDIRKREWVGLPWNTDPGANASGAWMPVPHGKYMVEKSDAGWIYLKNQDGFECKVDSGDVRVYWPGL